jgi:hypothetical protein
MRQALSLAALALALVACSKEEAPTAAIPSASPSGSAAAPAAQANAITFTVKAPSIGDKVEENETADMKIALTVQMAGQNKNADIHETETMKKRMEVLAVSGKAITKAKITYVEKTKVKTEGGKERKPPIPIAGKTYLVEAKDGKLVITDPQGKAVSRAEEEAVRKNNTSLGKPDPVLAGIPDKPVQVGEEVASLKKALEEFFKERGDGQDNPDVTDVKVTLEAIEGEGADKVGVFSLALTLSSQPSKKAPFAMKAPLSGKLKVRAKDGWTQGIQLAGHVTMTGDDPKVKIDGKGDMKMGVVMTY